jgi:altronate dehydratase
VPIGHKIALKDLKAGDTAIKYGEDIGKIIADIPKGGTSTPTTAKPNAGKEPPKIMASKYSNITVKGYRRENGRVGVRNHVLILPVDDISNAACEAVANNVKGTLAIPHAYGRLQFGEDLELHFRTMIGTGANPNVAAVVVIGIEPGWTKRIADGIRETGKPVAEFSIEQKGDFETIRAASWAAKEFVHWPPNAARRVLHLRALGLHQMRRERHHHRSRLLPDRRQHVRQAAARRHHRLLRRDLRDHRRRAHLPEARDQRRGRRALVQDVEGLSGRRDLRPPDR